MPGEHEPIVAKFGGTSMARPDHVLSLLNGEYDPVAVVVSAPGQDLSNRAEPKMTDLLYGYQFEPTAANRDRVLGRLSVVAQRYPAALQGSEIVDQAEAELTSWQSNELPVAALGEKWSAQLLARATHRTFVDASEVIVVNDRHLIDEAASVGRIRSRLSLNDRVVIPGFYGVNYANTITTLARGGSDITGAAVALALDAHYHNWTDVNGFYDRDPRHHSDAVLLERLTYTEALSIAQAGVELVHAHAITLLSVSGLATVVRNTFDAAGRRSVII